MPAKQRFRTYDHQGAPPIEEVGQQHQSNSRNRVDSARLAAALDIEPQLPSKEEILRFERSTRSPRPSQPLERIKNQGEEDSEAGAHGRIVPRSQHFVIILTNCIRYRINCGLQVSLQVNAVSSVFVVPLAVRTHEGLVFFGRKRRDLLGKMLALLRVIDLGEPFYFVADACYAAGNFICGLLEQEDHLISRVESNAVA